MSSTAFEDSLFVLRVFSLHGFSIRSFKPIFCVIFLVFLLFFELYIGFERPAEEFIFLCITLYSPHTPTQKPLIVKYVKKKKKIHLSLLFCTFQWCRICGIVLFCWIVTPKNHLSAKPPYCFCNVCFASTISALRKVMIGQNVFLMSLCTLYIYSRNR